jgi:hypothetical protein
MARVTRDYLQRLQEAWFEESLKHLEVCQKETCDWSNPFNRFLWDHGVGRELREKWFKHLHLTPDHRDFGKSLPTEKENNR